MIFTLHCLQVTPMTVPLSLLTTALLLSMSGTGAAGAAAPEFSTTSQMVLVPVTVTDRNARNVQGLRAEDFAIFDNQVSQRIVSFGTDDAPCSVVVVLDISGSMQRALAGAKDMLRAFLGTANPADEFLLLTVSTQPATLSRFTTDTAVLEQSMDFTRPGGLTSLIDTVYLGLTRMREARFPRRALLILSDGMDNHSRYSQSELMSVALEADVQVYTMIFDNGMPGSNTVPFRPGLAAKPWDVARESQGPELLEKLSNKTGGLYFHVHNDVEAKAAVADTGQALREEYLIGYQPSDTGTSGKYHQIRVKSNVPKVYVHARNGYYAR
jgi:Ca-activated chloride channel family protein